MSLTTSSIFHVRVPAPAAGAPDRCALFAVPLLYFVCGAFARLTPKLWLLFFLGGCQGLLGWYMVKSGRWTTRGSASIA